MKTRLANLMYLVLLSMLILTTPTVQAAFKYCGGGGAIDAGWTLGCNLGQLRLVNGIHVSAGCNDGEFGYFTAYFSDGSQENFYAGCNTTFRITPRFSSYMTIRMHWGGGGDSHISWYRWGAYHNHNAKISLNTETSNMTVEVGEQVKINASFIDIQHKAPYSYVLTWDDGNSSVGTVAGTQKEKGHISVDYAYMQEGVFNAKLEVTNSAGHTDSSLITVNVVPTVTDDPCDPSVITLRSNLPANMPFGMWGVPFTWDAARIPNKNDWVLIQKGHTVILPTTGQIKVKGICIEQNGVLRSYFNSFAAVSNVDISAATIWNKGTILSSSGVNGSLVNNTYKNAISGSNIRIYTNRFLNDITGLVSASGRGGDDILYPIYQNGAGVVDAFGGDGGSAEIYPVEFINKGIIEAGNGGDADTFDSWDDFVYGNAYGGQGGQVKVFASDLANSTNSATGQISAGNGGFADGIAYWLRYVAKISVTDGSLRELTYQGGNMYFIKGGIGGNVSVNLGNISGLIQGSPGINNHRALVYPTAILLVEPTTMTVDETTRFQDSENIVLFGGDDWVMDLRKLSPGAVHAIKNVIIAVGNGSVVDLRGVQDKVFIAGEKIDIYADEILLDAGVSIEDLVDAPEINVYGSKILYHVELSYDKRIIDEPNATIPVKVDVLNNGPTEDIYTVEITDEQGWPISQLREPVLVNGLRRTELSFEVTLPATRGAENFLTITVTSQNDPTVQAVANIRVSVREKDIIEPRNHKKADLTVVMDNTLMNAGVSLMIADAFEKTLMEKSDSSITDEQVADFVEQFDENHPLTEADLTAFLGQFETDKAIYEPVVELITVTNQAVSRVVSENIAEVIGQLRRLQTDIETECATASVSGLQAALRKINSDGQIILVTAERANAHLTRMITQIQEKGVKVHVILTGSCGSADKSTYANLAAQTGGTLTELTRGITTEFALQETLSDVITDAIDEVSKIVLFEYFIATITAEGNRIAFKTLIETGNAGFNLWRAEKNATGEFINIVKLNAELIPSQPEALYHFVDDTAEPNQVYYYAIETVNTDGVSQLHEDLMAVIKPDSLIMPADCLIYGIHDQGVNDSIAFTIEPETQEVFQFGDKHKDKDIESIAIQPDIRMVYVASGNDAKNSPKGHLYKMDAKTGELISVGHTGFDEISDLVFNTEGTKLWGWAKNQGMITINPTTGAGTLEMPSDILVEGFTMVEDHFYAAVNTTLWKYDAEAKTLEIACSNLPGETESLAAIHDDFLLMGLHDNSTLKVFDPNTCQVVESLSTGQFDDVEAVIWPTCQ